MRALVLVLPLAFVVALTAARVAEKPSHGRQVLMKEFVTEGASLGDVDGDGAIDLVAGPFWYAGPTFEKRNRYRPGDPVPIKGYAHDSFLSWVMDLNGDARSDILQIAHGGGFHLDIYLQPEQASEAWPQQRVVTGFGGESPHLVDVTGDDKPELIGMKEGLFGFFTADWKDVTKPWTFHAVSAENQRRGKGPYTHGLGVGDLNGDGRPDLVEKEGWFEAPEDPRAGPWQWHRYQFGPQGGAQMLVYDIDGDGDNDIVTSIHAHGYGLSWYENERADGAIRFKEHVILPREAKPGVGGLMISQMHALVEGDFNGDGLIDFVTGKRYWAHNGRDVDADKPALLCWFELKRGENGAEFIPHIIDRDSGVGTQVSALDWNGDGKSDIAVGNKKGVFVFTSQ